VDGPRLNVAVLLSGGVDSSLALRLLVAAGHYCKAFYLQIWFQVWTGGGGVSIRLSVDVGVGVGVGLGVCVSMLGANVGCSALVKGCYCLLCMTSFDQIGQ